MIKTNAIVLTVIFGFLLAKPAIPFINYLARKDFIIENFCINRDKKEIKCNGKCHLKDQVLKESEKDQQRNDPMPVREKNHDWEEYLMGQRFPERPEQVMSSLGIYYLPDYRFNYTQDIFHPPM